MTHHMQRAVCVCWCWFASATFTTSQLLMSCLYSNTPLDELYRAPHDTMRVVQDMRDSVQASLMAGSLCCVCWALTRRCHGGLYQRGHFKFKSCGWTLPLCEC
jgi:hypothetical protein